MPKFAVHRAAKDLAYGDILGTFAGEICTHCQQAKQGNQDGKEHEQFQQAHIVAGRSECFPEVVRKEVVVRHAGNVGPVPVLIYLADSFPCFVPVPVGLNYPAAPIHIFTFHYRYEEIVFFTGVGQIYREILDDTGHIFATICP